MNKEKKRRVRVKNKDGSTAFDATVPILDKKPEMEMEEIIPLKDWILNIGTHVYELKEGVEIEVPTAYLSSLKTEGVIPDND